MVKTDFLVASFDEEKKLHVRIDPYADLTIDESTNAAARILTELASSIQTRLDALYVHDNDEALLQLILDKVHSILKSDDEYLNISLFSDERDGSILGIHRIKTCNDNLQFLRTAVSYIAALYLEEAKKQDPELDLIAHLWDLLKHSIDSTNL